MKKTNKKQIGLTLIELLIAMVIGLATMGGALTALLHIQKLSGLNVDLSEINMHANNVMHAFGNQIRQAGSLKLNMGYKFTSKTEDDGQITEHVEEEDFPSIYERVFFEKPVGEYSAISKPSSTDDAFLILNNHYYKEYSMQNFSDFHADRCSPNTGIDNSISTIKFIFNEKEKKLICESAEGEQVTVADHVDDISISYFVKQGKFNASTILKVHSDLMTESHWKDVYAVEVCLTLHTRFSSEKNKSNETYQSCEIDKDGYPVLKSPDSANAGRVHRSFTNVFQIRSEGIIGL